MAEEKKKYAFDFEIISKQIPPQVYEAFALAQAQLFGLHGYITKTAEGFKGRIEGEVPEYMEKIKAMLDKAGSFASQIGNAVFSELKEIQEYTYEEFQVQKEELKKIVASDFEIMSKNIPPEVYEAYALAQAKLLGLHGHITKTAEGFKGRLEGEKEQIEKLKVALEKADEFVKDIERAVFTELKEIKEYTTELFEVKKSKK